MRSLVAFELKKILSRRVTQVTVASLFVVLALVMALNVLQQSGTDDAGNDVQGLAAIAQKKANAEADAGLVTEERATEAIRAYQTFFDSDGQIDEAFLAGGLSDPDSFYRYENRHVAFLGLLMRPWMVGYESVSDVAPRIDASTTVPLYDKVAASVQATLDNASDTWGYTPAERDFWMQKYESTAKPVAYGYAGGWSDILSCIDFLIFAIVAACVAAAPVFEASTRTGPTPWSFPPAMAKAGSSRPSSSRRFCSRRPYTRSTRPWWWACRWRSSAPTAQGCRCKASGCPSPMT